MEGQKFQKMAFAMGQNVRLHVVDITKHSAVQRTFRSLVFPMAKEYLFLGCTK